MSDISSDELFVKAPRKKLKVVEVPEKEEPIKIEIIIKEEDIERKRLVKLTNTIEEIFGNSEKLKIFYKNNLISKLLTFKDLNCVNEKEPFIICKDKTEVSVYNKNEVNLSICFEEGEKVLVSFGREKSIKDLICFLKEKIKLDKEILIINGVRLKEDEFIDDCLEDDDLLDFI